MVAIVNGCTADVQAEVWTEKSTDEMQANSISIVRMKSQDGQSPTG